MTIGLKDLYYSVITYGTGGAITYGTPARLAKAINADLSIETAKAELYADDALEVAISEFIKGELKLGVNELDPDGAVALFGCTKDSNNVIIYNVNDTAPEVAVGFRAKKPNGQYRYIWFYRVQFGVPTESFQTKGDSIEFKTPEITGTIMKRADGAWKADYTGSESTAPGSTWFNSVYVSPTSNNVADTGER